MNSHLLFVVAVLFLFVTCSTSAQAAVPQTLSYQGVLRDDIGGAVPDGSYEITFSLYNVETGGTSLWMEPQTITVTSGVFFAVLGSVTPLSLPFDEQYWLGISVAGEPQLAPRLPLTSAPYAYRAAYADAGDDGDWTISGDTVYHLDGDVGIGTASPLVDFEIRRDQDAYTGMVITNTDTGSNSREGIIFKNEDGETAGLQLYDEGSPVGAGMVLSNNRPSGYLRFTTSGAERMRVDTNGRVGIGVQVPSQLLDVAGTVRAEGFQMPTGATAGYVLTSDAGGNGAWTAPPSLTDDDWTISGDTVYHLDGDVGIGTASPLVDFEIRRDQDAYTGMVITNTDTGSNSREGIIFKNEDGETAGLQLYDEGSPVGAGMVLSNNRPSGYLRFTTSGAERMRVDTNGRVGIGVQVPSQLLDVAGTVRAEGFQMPTGATTGYVLTSDGSGYGTWTPPQAVPDGDWTVSGNSMSSSVSGNVGIGTATPQDKLEINGVLRLDQGAGNGNNIRFAEGGDLKWAILYRPWVNGNLTILDEVSLARSMTFESGTGDVGVKTEHPETDLHVVGEVRVDGDLQVNGTITHSAATSYYTVQPQEFVPVYATFTDYIMGGGMYTFSGTSASFVAPIHLPQGATVTGVTYHYTDNSTAGDNSLMVLRRSLSGTPDYVMATLSSSGSSGSGSATESTIDYATVDNTAYGYNILLYAGDGIVTYGVVFEYTTTTVD